MAHWYPVGQHYTQPQQPGQVPDIAYGPLAQPACLAPAYSQMPYVYGSVPMTVNGMQHVWVPFKFASEAMPYSQAFSQVQVQHASNVRQQIPFRGAQRSGPSRSLPEHDPLQMTWPDSPMTVQSDARLQHRSTSSGTSRTELSQHSASDSTPNAPQTPADGDCSHTQHAQAAFSRQLAHMSLSAKPASSHSSDHHSRCNGSTTSSTPADMLGSSSEAAESADQDATHGQTVQISQCISSTTQRIAGGGDREGGGAELTGPAWQWLTEGLLKDVMSKLPQHCLKRFRLICKRWRSAMDLHTQVHLMLRHARLLFKHSQCVGAALHAVSASATPSIVPTSHACWLLLVVA